MSFERGSDDPPFKASKCALVGAVRTRWVCPGEAVCATPATAGGDRGDCPQGAGAGHDRASGRTSAYLVAQVRARVDGIVQKREFKEGADVKAGQRLYQIDPAPL